MMFEWEWQEAPGVKDRVLAATWARLTIRLRDAYLTELLDLRSTNRRTAVYGSLFPLAEWVVEHWWHLLHEPARFSPLVGGRAAKPWMRRWVQRHCLLAARDGAALPDLTLARDGNDILLLWNPDPPAHDQGRVRFIGEGRERLPASEVRTWLAGLVDAVVYRLDDLGLADEDTARLRANWAAVQASEATEPELCRSLAILGLDPYDPDEATDEVLATLERAVALPAPLRDDLLEGTEHEELAEDLEWLDQGRSRLTPGRLAVRPMRRPSAATAHETGYLLAQEARASALGLDPVSPIADLPGLLVDRLGWSADTAIVVPGSATTRLDGLVGQVEHGQPAIIVPGSRSPESERFRLGRAAFCVLSGEASTSPRLLSGAFTWMQRASRAFAAELLVPSAALAKRVFGLVTQAEVQIIANEYSVSPLLVRHQIENHDLGFVEE